MKQATRFRSATPRRHPLLIRQLGIPNRRPPKLAELRKPQKLQDLKRPRRLPRAKRRGGRNQRFPPPHDATSTPTSRRNLRKRSRGDFSSSIRKRATRASGLPASQAIPHRKRQFRRYWE